MPFGIVESTRGNKTGRFLAAVFSARLVFTRGERERRMKRATRPVNRIAKETIARPDDARRKKIDETRPLLVAGLVLGDELAFGDAERTFLI